MTRTKEKPVLAVEALRPYVKRAMEDPDLREDLVAAFIAARGLYSQIAKSSGVKGKAEKVSEKDFQNELQDLVSEISDASERLQGKKEHKTRNRVILLTGVTLGVLYNPWTGAATREWIMTRVAGENGGFEDYADALGEDAGNGDVPTTEI